MQIIVQINKMLKQKDKAWLPGLNCLTCHNIGRTPRRVNEKLMSEDQFHRQTPSPYSFKLARQDQNTTMLKAM